MKNRLELLVILPLSLMLAAVPDGVADPGPAGSERVGTQEDAEEDTGTKKKKNKDKKKGNRTKWGAGVGAMAGLAMGAMTGDARVAAAGAAVGAGVGAAAGNQYDYDQDRQDDRTEMLADAIASKNTAEPSAVAPAPTPTETVGDVGRRQMEHLLGDWNIDIWVLAEDGKRIPATGTAKGISAGENGVRLLYRDLAADGYEGALDGFMMMNYDPGQGFFLENSWSNSDEVMKLVGEYLVDRNAYNFYLVGSGGEMVQGGILRSSLRLEVRISGPAMWVVDTFTLIDGEEVQVQSYRFTRI